MPIRQVGTSLTENANVESQESGTSLTEPANVASRQSVTSLNESASITSRESGASLTEFILAAPLVMLVGMTTVQAGLIYHGKTTLNYATFEAARAGAVNNAQLASMQEALGLRLSPVQGGDGSTERAMAAIAKSALSVQDKARTRIDILNPTTAAFEDWGIVSPSDNRRVIPNNHLRHKDHAIGSASGLSLRDANLLKIEVTYGIDMRVPVVSGLIARGMTAIDPDNAIYYARNQFPVSAVATVRMQSEAWEGEIVAAAEAASAVGQPVNEAEGEAFGEDGQATTAEGDVDPEVSADNELCNPDNHGLGSNPVLLQASAYENEQCLAQEPGFGGLGEEQGNEPVNASGDCV